ncbi:MAG: amidohydrolase family protein [Acidimicrobiia bacterium]|nr:amidohydrolase family protein [Acidimicrobiia bacterium]
MTVIDSDQHLVESRGLWREYVDPADRDLALTIDDDAVGNAWLMGQGERLGLAEVQTPGETDVIGERHERARRGEAPAVRYDDALPRDHWDPDARVARLDAMGIDEAVLFPNYGLLWERRLTADRAALLANMRAWNRWCAAVAGTARLHPVAHLSLSDLDWLDAELAALAAAGVKTAMIAPALVDGRPLSHPDLDRAWAAFVTHDIAPVFHVADQPRVFDDAWYPPDGTNFVPVLDSVFLSTAAALACTDLIVHGVLERHPALRIGIVELSAVWVPMFLMMLDGGYDFTARLNGSVPAPLSLRPSEYFRRQVRVSSFSYELPENIRAQLQGADLLMACSDFPHSEGTATPLDDYAATGRYGIDPDRAPGLFADNAAFLLGR